MSTISWSWPTTSSTIEIEEIMRRGPGAEATARVWTWAMTIQQILEAAMAVEKEIEDTPHGSPEFAAVLTRIAELQDELIRARSVQGQLIPDSSSPKTADEESAIYLGQTLRSLMEAVNSKR